MPLETSKPPPKGFAAFMKAMNGEEETKQDGMDYQEAGVMPRLLFGKGNPLRLNRKDRNAILAAMPLEKIRDEVTVPAMKEIEKGTNELKDSANAYMHRFNNVPEWLIKEAIADGLRKAGK